MGYGFTQVNVEVGEEVGVARCTRYGFQSHRFGTISKVNGHGHIFVALADGKELRFDKHGDAYKDKYGPSLFTAAHLRNDLAVAAKHREQRATAIALQSAVQGGFTGSGRFWATPQRIAEIKELLNKLEELVD
jgi:hypothetical protein